MVFVIFCSFVILAVLIWQYFKHVYNFWEKRGIVTPPYRYLFGHLGDSILMKRSTGAIYTDIYKENNGYNYVGFYKFMQPGLVIRNPDIVKDILLKNFNSFHDNDLHIDEKHDLILGKNPFILKGNKWKVARNRVTPCFSASKMKQVVPFLQVNAQKMVKYLEKELGADNGNGVEAKYLCNLYTAENTANCAFGVEADCFTNPKAEFKEKALALSQPSFWQGLKILLSLWVPSLSQVLNIKFITDDITDFFKSVVKQTIHYRKANKVRKNDFIDFMLDTQERVNDEKEFGFDDIVANVGGFFLDGFETSSTAISYTLYEIASHSDVQEKLRSEINSVLERHGGEYSYDAIQEMVYLDCVFKENLRKNVPLLAMTKLCTEPYTLPPMKEDNSGPEYRIEPGTPIIIPVYGLHMDEKYYHEPERFVPERFSGENKNNAKSLYLSFGEGPRICLGRNFGILQSKIAIAAAVANFEMTVNKRTKEPLELDHRHFLIAPIGGLWLNFKRI